MRKLFGRGMKASLSFALLCLLCAQAPRRLPGSAGILPA